MLTPSAVAAAPIRMPSSIASLLGCRPLPGGSLTAFRGAVGAIHAATVTLVDVRLVPVAAGLRERLLKLAPRPGQERFSGALAETLPVAEADPEREPVAILAAGEPV